MSDLHPLALAYLDAAAASHAAVGHPVPLGQPSPHMAAHRARAAWQAAGCPVRITPPAETLTDPHPTDPTCPHS